MNQGDGFKRVYRAFWHGHDAPWVGRSGGIVSMGEDLLGRD